MSRLRLCFLFIFLFVGAGNELAARQGPPAGSPEVRGEWVARQAEERETGRDGRVALRMRLFDRQARMRERALTLLTLRGPASKPGAPKLAADVIGDRTLVRFTYPNDINGTGFLVWEHPSADDERFLYLPALGRVRRIASSETQGSFVGSDFTYEDIGGREFENYTYRLLDAATVWKAPDGTTHQVYTLESRSRDANARFPRVISLIRQDNLVVVRAEIHNRRDEVQKIFEVRRLERVDGYWTALEMHMADVIEQSRTELVVEKADYDVGLTADHFSRRELERGVR